MDLGQYEEDPDDKTNPGQVYKRRGSPNDRIVVLPASGQRFARDIDNYHLIGKHKAIIELKGFTERADGQCLVLEYAPNGTLLNLFERVWAGEVVPEWTPTFRAKAVFGLAAALMRIHARVMAHRRFYPSLILLDQDWNVKVSGLIYARTEGAPLMSEIATAADLVERLFFDPTIIEHPNEYTNTIDIYAYGMLVYCLATGKKPTLSSKNIMKALSEGTRPDIPGDLNPNLTGLIDVSWNPDVEIRWSAEKICQWLLDVGPLFDGVNMKEYDLYVRSVLSVAEYEDLKRKVEPSPAEVAFFEEFLRKRTTGALHDIEKLKYAMGLQKVRKNEYKCQAYQLFCEVSECPDPVYGAMAKYNKGMSLLLGTGVKVDGAQAIEAFQAVLDGPNGPPDQPPVQAMINDLRAKSLDRLGCIYNKGMGRRPDRNRAFELFRQSAEAGSPKGMAHYAEACRVRAEKAKSEDERENFYKTAREYFAKAYQHKETSGANEWVKLRLEGKGGPQEIEQSLKILETVASNPENVSAPMASFNMGEICERGLYGHPVDLPKAKEYYEQSFKASNTLAAVALINMLADEIEHNTAADERDNINRIEYMLRWASDSGIWRIVKYAADFLWNGRAGIHRPREAIDFVKNMAVPDSMARKQDRLGACQHLAKMYKEGKGHLFPPDPDQADYWETQANALEMRRSRNNSRASFGLSTS